MKRIVTGNLISFAGAESVTPFETPNSTAIVDQFRTASRMRVASLERDLQRIERLAGTGQNERRLPSWIKPKGQ
jgi:hypothetical protein